MTGKTHQMIGFTVGLGSFLAVTTPSYNPATFAAVAVVSSMASLLPDIDSPTGEIWHSLPFGHTWGKLSDPFLKHRNITHSILGFCLISWGASLILAHMPVYWGIQTNPTLIAFMLAYASHLIADSVTVEGIPLFFPLGKMFGIPPKPFEGVRIVTGKWFENLIIFPLVNIILIVLLITKWQAIKLILFK